LKEPLLNEAIIIDDLNSTKKIMEKTKYLHKKKRTGFWYNLGITVLCNKL
jgi:hypothetical protein